MKVESRGKYPGVKVHLDPEECQWLLDLINKKVKALDAPIHLQVTTSLAIHMGQSIRDLIKEQPALLEERTPEQIAAILAKESEKAGIQLNRLKNGKDWKKIEPEALKKALLHHVKE